MKKILSFIIISFVIVISIGIFFVNNARSETQVYDLNGWAWSSNIGWISFNSSDSGAGGGPYKVQVTSTGDNSKFSGYAWSPNVGWLNFNSNGTCLGSVPTLDLSNGKDRGKVTGRLQFVAGLLPSGQPRTDGWDGCVELSDNGNNKSMTGTGVTMDPVTGQFKGFAWGGPVVGWIQFDPLISSGLSVICSNYCGGGGGTDFALIGGGIDISSNSFVGSTRVKIVAKTNTMDIMDVKVTSTIDKVSTSISPTSCNTFISSTIPGWNYECSNNPLLTVRLDSGYDRLANPTFYLNISGKDNSSGTTKTAVITVSVGSAGSANPDITLRPYKTNNAQYKVDSPVTISIRKGKKAYVAWNSSLRQEDYDRCKGSIINNLGQTLDQYAWVLGSYSVTQPTSISIDDSKVLDRGIYTLKLICTPRNKSLSPSVSNEVTVRVQTASEEEF